jgi:diguanylate cyclase (GGDEF)-like protein
MFPSRERLERSERNMKKMDAETDETTTIEQEELRGIARSVGEIEWLLLIVVMLYHVFGGTDPDDRPAVVFSMVLYCMCIMGFRYANFFQHESRWKLAVETWIMTGFITVALMYTGRLESPLLNTYLLVIITSALALGKLTTLLELALIAACMAALNGGDFSSDEVISLKFIATIFAQFAPFVLVAYITTMFASDIRYGLSKAKLHSETDHLTETLNRRGFAIVSDRLFGQAVRYNRPLSLLLIDCDNLKPTNDDLGHKAGDTLLLSVVKNIQQQLRATDLQARYGGDEFIVLLPETSAVGAVDVAERIRAAVEETSLALGGELVNTTVSIGTASYPQDGINLDLLLACADRNMCEAKRAGRNRVVHHAARPASPQSVVS